MSHLHRGRKPQLRNRKANRSLHKNRKPGSAVGKGLLIYTKQTHRRNDALLASVAVFLGITELHGHPETTRSAQTTHAETQVGRQERPKTLFWVLNV